jgi:phosphatidylglycerophosphatase C
MKHSTIAAFDFDGTLIRKDSLPLFIIFSSGFLKLFAGTLRMLPHYILFKLKIISNNDAKSKLCKIFFSGYRHQDFIIAGSRFMTKLNKSVNPEALKKVKWHQEMGHHVVIISASVENWIIPWALDHGINEVLATKMEVVHNGLTGELLTENCHGIEKVNRLLAAYPDRASYTLFAYGDSDGDKELLAMSDFPYYQCFN